MAESILPDPRRQAAQPDDVTPGAPVPAPAPSRTSLIPADPSRDLAGALHEVSNALTVLIGWIERARGPESSPEEVERALEVAATRASQARSIVRHAIGAEVHAEPPAPVGAVVGDALTGLEPELRRAGIRAACHVSPALREGTVDHASTVLQILTNLLLNAIALSPAGSTVRVEAEPAPERGERGVIFAVTDEGPGIPPERRATLFQANLSTRAGGAGIGLRHAAALAHSHGGALALGSGGGGAGGGGARFELTWPFSSSAHPTPMRPPPESGTQHLDLPRDADPLAAITALGAARPLRSGSSPDLLPVLPAPPSSRSLPRSLSLAGTRILLVEDDEAVVDLLDTALTARGADVVSIRHQRELHGALATGPFDAALFDISPIQDDVRGAVASARGSSDALRVVLISGSAAQMPEMPPEWVAAWVRKPFEISEILHAIEPVSPRAPAPGQPPAQRPTDALTDAPTDTAR